MARRPSPRNWPLYAAIAAGVACVLAYVAHTRVTQIAGLDDLERRSIDLRFRIRGPQPIREPRIVIVGLDDRTRAEAPEIFQTRRGWAKLITALGALRPRAIALDLFFSSPEIMLLGSLPDEVRAAAAAAAADPAPSPALQQARAVLDRVVDELRGDEVLAAAVAGAKVVYLGAAFRLIERASDRRPTPPRVPAGLEKGEVGEAIGGGGGATPSASGVAATLPAIARGAAGAGAVNHYRDPDGVARRMPLVVEIGGRYVASLGLNLAALAAGQSVRYVAASGEVWLGARRIPTTRAAVRLDYLGTPFPRVSAADVLAGRVAADALADKLVLVGYTYHAYDKVPTPYDPLTDGVELHATLLHNLLHGGVLRDASPAANLGAVVVLAALAALLQLRVVRRRPWLPIVGALGVMLAWLVVAQLAFDRGVVVELVGPPLAVLAVTLVAAAVTAATEGREKSRLRSAFAQYVSRTLVERILANPAAARLGGERRELTVLFSDIRGFSRLAESLPPERLADFLNQYLTPMTELVLERDGTLDKYIGDAVMAVWNAPVDVPDHAGRACGTALAMLEELERLNARWKAEGLPSVAIGIGINTGPMSVGNMGSEARFDYTVLGDAVNLGARLESLTKEYGVDVLVGEATRAAAAPAFTFRELDRVRVVGKDRSATIFELLGQAGATAHTADDLAAWERMLAAYRARDFETAETELRGLAVRHPDDGPTRIFLERVRELAANPPGADWDGVYEQRSK